MTLQFVGLFIGIAFAIAVHESGHLFCAVAASIAVRRVTVGVGPLLLRGRIGETGFELRLFPANGFVSIFPLGVVRKFRLALFILGGVLANALALAIVTVLGLAGAFPARLSEWGDFMTPVVLMQAYVMIVNLLPFRVKIHGERRASDGLQLLQLWPLPRDAATAAGLAYAELVKTYCPGAAPAQASPASSRIMYHVLNAERWTDREARRGIHESLIRELARGGLPAGEEAVVLDLLITDGLVFGEPSVRPLLDALSSRAVGIAPHVKTLWGSRGAVLVELGRCREGREILEALVEETGFRPFDRFMTRLYLAHAALALGNVDAAHDWAAAASGIDIEWPAAAEMIERFMARRDEARAQGTLSAAYCADSRPS